MKIRKKGTNSIFSNEVYPVERDKRVFLSGKLGYAPGDGSALLGVIFYDSNDRQITGPEINRIQGTLTSPSQEAKAGESKLVVSDASRWRIGGLPAVGKEIPAPVLSPVAKIEKYDGGYGIFLKKPLKKTLEAGTPIALHGARQTYQYVFSGKVSGNCAEVGGELQWWPGTVKYRVVLLSPVPVQVKDLKLAVYKK